MLKKPCSKVDFRKSSADTWVVTRLELNDRWIRQALIHKLTSQPAQPKAIIEELWVHNGNAIADVVALNDEAHCYEIKGRNDKVERVIVQGSFYNACFRRITLVTTDRGLQKSLKVTPPFWGVLVARIEEGKIQLHEVRPARNNPNFIKQLAVLTLWKSEMLNLLPDPSHRRKPRETLARLISAAKGKIELSVHICALLVERKRGTESERQDRDHVGQMRVHGRFDYGSRRSVVA